MSESYLPIILNLDIFNENLSRSDIFCIGVHTDSMYGFLGEKVRSLIARNENPSLFIFEEMKKAIEKTSGLLNLENPLVNEFFCHEKRVSDLISKFLNVPSVQDRLSDEHRNKLKEAIEHFEENKDEDGRSHSVVKGEIVFYSIYLLAVYSITDLKFFIPLQGVGEIVFDCYQKEHEVFDFQ